MKLALRLLGWLVAIVVIGYFVLFAINTFRSQDLSSLITLPVIAAIVFAACLYALIVPFSCVAWAALLRRQGESWSPTELSTILAVTQFAKYIPGGIAQPVGRAAMSLRHGMKLRAFTATVIQESLLAVAASVAVGLCMLLFSSAGMSQIPVKYRDIVPGGALAAIASVFLLASGAAVLPKQIRKQRRISTMLDAIGPSPGTSATLVAFAIYCLNYLMTGFGIWLIGQALGLGTNGSFTLLTAAFSLAWMFGFVMPGAPAGLGVREGVMAILLAGTAAQSEILALVIATRVATVMGDGFCFGTGYWGLRHMKRETN